jgi:hypothetical protein
MNTKNRFSTTGRAEATIRRFGLRHMNYSIARVDLDNPEVPREVQLSNPFEVTFYVRGQNFYKMLTAAGFKAVICEDRAA